MKPISTTLPAKTYPLASCIDSEREAKMTKAKRGRYTLEFKHGGDGTQPGSG